MWLLRNRRESRGTREAKKALAEAEQHLQQIKEREVEVNLVSKESRDFRIENHFAADLREIMIFRPRRRNGGTPRAT